MKTTIQQQIKAVQYAINRLRRDRMIIERDDKIIVSREILEALNDAARWRQSI